jgi:hypothetical protein
MRDREIGPNVVLLSGKEAEWIFWWQTGLKHMIIPKQLDFRKNTNTLLDGTLPISFQHGKLLWKFPKKLCTKTSCSRPFV